MRSHPGKKESVRTKERSQMIDITDKVSPAAGSAKAQAIRQARKVHEEIQ